MKKLALSLLFLLPGCASAPRTEPRIVLPPRCDTGKACGPDHALVWNDSNPIPRFPPVLRSAGVEGEVSVRFAVSEGGTVDSSSIAVLTSTNKAFVPGTVQALSKWKFGTRSGRNEPGANELSIKVRFSQVKSCVGSDYSVRAAWGEVSSTSTLVLSACQFPLVPRDQVARNRAAAGMPPLDPPR